MEEVLYTSLNYINVLLYYTMGRGIVLSYTMGRGIILWDLFPRDIFRVRGVFRIEQQEVCYCMLDLSRLIKYRHDIIL